MSRRSTCRATASTSPAVRATPARASAHCAASVRMTASVALSVSFTVLPFLSVGTVAPYRNCYTEPRAGQVIPPGFCRDCRPLLAPAGAGATRERTRYGGCAHTVSRSPPCRHAPSVPIGRSSRYTGRGIATVPDFRPLPDQSTGSGFSLENRGRSCRTGGSMIPIHSVSPLSFPFCRGACRSRQPRTVARDSRERTNRSRCAPRN